MVAKLALPSPQRVTSILVSCVAAAAVPPHTTTTFANCWRWNEEHSLFKGKQHTVSLDARYSHILARTPTTPFFKLEAIKSITDRARDMAGRQVASFVLGSVATLAVVLLLQHRPEELLSRRPLASAQFVGLRGRRNNAATSSAEAAIITNTGGDGGVAAGDDNDVTKRRQQQPHPAGGPTRSLPSSSGDRQEEVR
jgi:hypothetical protein